MSGEGTAPPAAGQVPGVASDQSMEDILASIRRILNEDEAQGGPPAGPAEGAAADTPAAAPEGGDRPGTGPAEAEPLLLTEEMMVAAPEETPPPAAEPAPVPAGPAVTAPAAAERPDTLLAPAAAAAAAASVSELLRAVSTERTAVVTRGGPSIEDVVREEIRPLLKAWLDAHLPPMVERLVRAEIERVVGRALS